MTPTKPKYFVYLLATLFLVFMVMAMKTGLFDRQVISPPPRAWVFTTRPALSLSDMGVRTSIEDDHVFEDIIGKPLAASSPIASGMSMKGFYLHIRRHDGRDDCYYIGADWQSLYDEHQAQWFKVDLSKLKEHLLRQDAIRE
jgi:hypothetical protein